MKKIILIDDNSHNQRELYGASFVDNGEYNQKDNQCLIHKEKLNKESDLSFLQDAACVMIHDSLEDYIDGKFQPDSHKVKERIDNILQDMNVPYVMFSDGHAMEADWREDAPDVIYAIKKSEFYLNLKPFLDEYIKSGKIDLRIIAFGEKYMVHMMRTWYANIIKKMSGYKDDDIILEDMIDIRSLRQFIANADLGDKITFNYIMHKVEEEAYTIKDFREKINNIINDVLQYGKNISTWE